MTETRFDEWEAAAVAWLDGRQLSPPEPLKTGDILGLLQLCKRAYAIEYSVTQGQERALRDGYARLLGEVLGVTTIATTTSDKGE